MKTTRLQTIPFRAGHFFRRCKMRWASCASSEVGGPSASADQLNQILVFDDLHGFLDELQSYSRELDAVGEPTERIEAKETFHLLDAIRYVISYLHMDKPKGGLSGAAGVAESLNGLA